MRIETTELEKFHKDLLEKQYKYARPGLNDTPWGTKDMTITDPSGNRLTFTTAVST